jgi:hypothetical protein
MEAMNKVISVSDADRVTATAVYYVTMRNGGMSSEEAIGSLRAILKAGGIN